MTRVSVLLVLLTACSLQDFDSLQNGDVGPNADADPMLDGGPDTAIPMVDGGPLVDGGPDTSIPLVDGGPDTNVPMVDGGPDAGPTYEVCRDMDGDGYGNPAMCMNVREDVAGYVRDGTDCDDGNPEAFPGNPELCSTAFDDDCDMDINEADASDASSWYPDEDGDGDGAIGGTAIVACTRPDGYAATATDCVDDNPQIFPDADEICNGRDDTCEGAIDEGMTLVGSAVDLQTAIDEAAVGATLCVSGDRTGDYALDKNITVAARDGRTTTLTGTGTGPVLTISAGIFEGFTLTGGGGVNRGGGILVPTGNPTVRGTRVRGNTLTPDDSYGAGIFVAAPADLTLENALVTGNTIRCPNRPGAAGVASFGALTMRNVSIVGNTVDVITFGSAIYGAGLTVRGENAVVVATNLIVLGNTATYSHTESGRQHWGTGVNVGLSGSLDVTNGVIAGNSNTLGTTNIGVGVCVDGLADGGLPAARSSFTNVINAFNTTDLTSGGVGYLSNFSAVVDVRYGNTFSNQRSGVTQDFQGVSPTDSISEDPLFGVDSISPLFWNVDLLAGSPCIDMGDPSILDADGTRSDIGAYGGPAGDSW